VLPAPLTLEQARRYLVDAPQIMKAIAPVSWTYITPPPQDGMLWLEWQSQDRWDRFASDGIAWANEQEEVRREEVNGYTIEIRRQMLGFKPQVDSMASHARTRYHLLAKNPQTPAAPPDPNLWIVHYHQADRQQWLPAGQVPFTPSMQAIINERRWLEHQGRIETRQFMLHDRSSWPMVNLPGPGGAVRGPNPMQNPGFYPQQGMPPGAQRFPYYPQQPSGPREPPTKRPRTHQTSMGGSTSDPAHPHAMPDTTIEDEENTAFGDFFDHLTPRDISMTRYMQHHRWMEEVFNSPYASHQIVPVDLGMGLMGELKGLTDGILSPPSMDLSLDQHKPPKAKEAEPFTSLTKDQLAEFNSRVTKHLENGQAEIQRMKDEHGKKMAEWRKSKTLMQAEKKLRYATWSGHESAVPAFRLELPEVLNAQADGGAQKETVEDVLKEVEEALGGKIIAQKEVALVEKGGLEDHEPSLRPQAPPSQAQPKPQTNTNGQVADVYHADPVPKPSAPSADPVVQATAPAGQPIAQQPATAQVQEPQAATGGPGGSVEDDVMEGMDVDMSEENIDFNFDDSQMGGEGVSETPAGAAIDATSAAPPATSAQESVANTPAVADSTVGQTSSAEEQAPTNQGAVMAGGDTNEDTSMFDPSTMEGDTGMTMDDDNTFADLAGLDDAGATGSNLMSTTFDSAQLDSSANLNDASGSGDVQDDTGLLDFSDGDDAGALGDNGGMSMMGGGSAFEDAMGDLTALPEGAEASGDDGNAGDGNGQ
jgi:hypothetical protein